mgnify:CR=1 FL=1
MLLKEILEYPITRLDLLNIIYWRKLELEKEDRAVIDYVSFYIKYLSLENVNMSLIDVYEIISKY